MAELKRCPKCGSQAIRIDGVLQRKKGLMYYLTGTGINDAGKRSGFKAGVALKHLDWNAECTSCGHKWLEK